MHVLYLVSVWVHILAATVWFGGMLFLVLVVVPGYAPCVGGSPFEAAAVVK